MSDDAVVALAFLADRAFRIQREHSRRWDGPSDMLIDCAEWLAEGTRFLKQDAVILRGMIQARSYEKTPYHEAIVPVLQEALDVLEALTSAK